MDIGRDLTALKFRSLSDIQNKNNQMKLLMETEWF